MDKREQYYITTPIYYPSDKLHIGHAYTTVAADALARWNRLKGKDVFFLTGTDEHGQKIERIAKANQVTPKAYVDHIVADIKSLWDLFDISYDDFIRTTEPRHTKIVQQIFKKIYDNGDIYKSEYSGWYCTPCETFWREDRLEDHKCPDCRRDVELVKEESYFFQMSKYADRLLDYIKTHPEFIQPRSRRNEMISFIESGLEDLCVSRTTFDWGIPVPIAEGHVIYVWVDALSNYITAIGYGEDEETFNRYWPADVHLVGKEIMRFHTIIWPIILMALDLPLPTTVFGHGWLLFEDGKMSKSKGNVVDPRALARELGVDAVRYFLLREVSFGHDGSYSRRSLIERMNADLANDLGNSLHRSLAMLGRYFEGVIPSPEGDLSPTDEDLQEVAADAVKAIDRHLERLEINVALVELWKVVRRINKYIDENEPWALARDGHTPRLKTVMYHVFEALRIVALALSSFLPKSAEKIWHQIGVQTPLAGQTIADTAWGGLSPGAKTAPGEPIFPRFDLSLEDEADDDEENTEERPKQDEKTAARKKDDRQGEDGVQEITIDDFGKLDLRVAKVVEAEPVAGADRLLKLQVDLGDERRQVVAGIAQQYKPEELIGKKIVIVANLKPVKLRGELSQGMILAASDDNGLGFVTVDPDREVELGSRVK